MKHIIYIAVVAVTIIWGTQSIQAQRGREAAMASANTTNTTRATSPKNANVTKATTNALDISLAEPPVIEVKEIFESMSEGKRPGVKVNVPGANPIQVINSWKHYLRNYDVKSKSRRGEIFSDNATIEQLSDEVVDIYTKVEAYQGGVLVKSFFRINQAYVSDKLMPDQFEVVANLMRNFAVTETANTLKEQLALKESELLELHNKRDLLQMEASDLQSDVQLYNIALKETEKQLKNNTRKQEQTSKKAEKQIAAIEQLRLNLQSVLTPSATGKKSAAKKTTDLAKSKAKKTLAKKSSKSNKNRRQRERADQ